MGRLLRNYVSKVPRADRAELSLDITFVYFRYGREPGDARLSFGNSVETFRVFTECESVS